MWFGLIQFTVPPADGGELIRACLISLMQDDQEGTSGQLHSQ